MLQSDFNYELVRTKGVELTSTKEDELGKAFDDLTHVIPKFKIDRFLFVLSPNSTDVSGSCGEYKTAGQWDTISRMDEYPKDECWVVPPECATRGYSEHRWRVNRTLQGVLIHELGHHIERQFYKHTQVEQEDIKEVFKPETDITNYSDKNYAENFAESWRVYVTNPMLLAAINTTKREFFDEWFEHDRDNIGFLEQSIQEMNGIVRNQLEGASTNTRIRESLDNWGIDYMRKEDE